MKKQILTLFTGGLLAAAAHAQNETDLYRYSNTFNEGSARFEAMAGSFGALGADIGSARINPAGFGRYSSSQFTFGLSGVTSGASADFRGTTTDDGAFKLRLANLGIVLTNDKSANRDGFLYQQVGIGYTGVANFGGRMTYEGQQFESLLDGFAGQAYGYSPSELATYFPFSTSLAYETYAIDYDGTGYVPRLTYGDMWHKRTVDTRGGINELHFSYSINYLNKLYIGANLGWQFLRYTEYNTHQETLLDTTGVSLRSFEYLYNLKTSGNGTNLKVGAIYLPVDNVRFGLAVHTPTFFTLIDNWEADMTATHNDGVRQVPTDLKPTGNYKYRLRTPTRVIGSFAYVFGTRGCFNFDAEYLDYRSAHFKSTKDQTYQFYDYKVENQAADERFQPVVNLRAGLELVFASSFFVRGGYGYFPKGDKALHDFGGKADQLISGGLGVRLNSWTFDAAVKSLLQTKQYVAFTDSSPASVRTNQMYFVVNAQYKF